MNRKPTTSTALGKVTLSIALVSSLLVALFMLQSNTANISSPSNHARALVVENEDEIIKELTTKLKPTYLDNITSDDIQHVLTPHQFIHLHHMKTGGTSMDHMLKCAMNRLRSDFHYEIPYYNLHECARGKFKKCKAGEDYQGCRTGMNKSAILSYCAPLKDLPAFGYDAKKYQSMTVLRHPVGRVWSMFRFETRNCYICHNLTEIYHQIDTNTVDPRIDRLCLAQLQNHEVQNLLSSDWPDDAPKEDLLAEAIKNMKEFFTFVGLTEELQTTAWMAGKIFPWLNETLEGSEIACPFPHDNASPKNNHCGPDFTHWPLPAHPDEETYAAIEAHNQLDLKLYEAAVEHFRIQKIALGLQGDDE
jgi:hypothetical protein